MKSSPSKGYKKIMKLTGKFEAAVTALIPRTEREWTQIDLDLLSIAATVDALVLDIVDINERLTKQLTEITESVKGGYTYISPLHASRVDELTEKVAKLNAFRESLYVMVGMVLGLEARKQFMNSLG